MNSTILINDTVYVPFWIVIEYLDCNIQDPFIRCKVLSIRSDDMHNQIAVSDLELGKPNLIAFDVPINYLISQSEIEDWKRNIADWFLQYQVRP